MTLKIKKRKDFSTNIFTVASPVTECTLAVKRQAGSMSAIHQQPQPTPEINRAPLEPAPGQGEAVGSRERGKLRQGWQEQEAAISLLSPWASTLSRGQDPPVGLRSGSGWERGPSAPWRATAAGPGVPAGDPPGWSFLGVPPWGSFPGVPPEDSFPGGPSRGGSPRESFPGFPSLGVPYGDSFPRVPSLGVPSLGFLSWASLHGGPFWGVVP